MSFIVDIEKNLGLRFVLEIEIGNVCYASNNENLRNEFKEEFSLMNLLDYLIASVKNKINHSQDEQQQLFNWLLPKNTTDFWKFVKMGEIKRLDILSERKFIFPKFIEKEDNLVSVIKFSNNNIYINTDQYFDNISELIWNFSIGEYQPAQEWLKKYKGEKLNSSNVSYYQNLLIALQIIEEERCV